jgi:uncharacterized protein YjbJ (UPF0337 family)
MDKDIIDGDGEQVKSALNKAVGKLTCNKSLEIRGKAENTIGKVQAQYGKNKEYIRKAIKNSLSIELEK